ncbi:hypothetical protein JP28_11930 [Gallibacterium anatis]|uniref:BREX system P-loop protein BrxC n=1 Tax=Gallibacterium anatis TaxID=750 RepID=UPI000530ECD1|nr:BREX system P-loop protein BrxC [Gallibacterium anatis]KGQ42161.1 hypothetical protein JP28_11930 [Gallibacterium anatis]KGQ58281.1 hypothetical protein IO45_09670 [Gallibacterium anatis]
MKNQDIYLKNPKTEKLANEGVASVNNTQADVLRYELETFVCEGQYEKGMAHILETYLSNINQAQQPAVWVSGFFGSGKSHLVKMLRALWVDMALPDGSTARGIAQLPENIQHLFKELSTQGKRHGGLYAASGTLGAGANGSVRLALLGIVFKSRGLPEQYPMARFVMWLKQEGIEEEVRRLVEENSGDWQEELDNLHVAEDLHQALVQVKPQVFPSTEACVQTLNNLYPYVEDITSEQMIKAIRQALSQDGQFPLTLIVLDEVQQYIGENSQKSIEVQEVVETCSKEFEGKLLFIGTGQTAVTGTSNLKKLEGRFTVRVELSDNDVDAVVRKVILAKKTTALDAIQTIMQNNSGEIARHLQGTSIASQRNDEAFFEQDYPILPVRRRFWEATLRALDQTGTDSQLRNQLSTIHKAVQSNLDKPVGNVIPTDFLYFDSADKLLQSRVLPRKLYETTFSWIQHKDEDKRLLARACGLVFLINKLSSKNKEIGIQATVDTLADLMVEDLAQGSSALRNRLPELLNQCELLMKVGNEYRIQTEESTAWNDDFQNQKSTLSSETYRLESDRNDRIRRKFAEILGKPSLIQGNAKVSRTLFPIFDDHLPKDANEKITIWVQDGWSIDEDSFRAEARQAGTHSPVIFVFIPKRSADDLRHQLIEYKAAEATLNHRGAPDTAEGQEARAYIETVKNNAEGKIQTLLSEAFSGAKVLQGGGQEIIGSDLKAMILEAADNAMHRLYPQFDTADHAGWAKVYENAKKGAPDALKAIGEQGEPAQNPVCKAILSYIGNGKKGIDIRTHFESAPYGWSGDAIDGGLQVLLVAGLAKAEDERGGSIMPTALERKNIGKTTFKAESITITMPQRLQIRKLLQKLELSTAPEKEAQSVQQLVQKLTSLAECAGGDAPKPEQPNTALIEEIRHASGNAQLLAIYEHRAALDENISAWQKLGEGINKRWPSWLQLKQLIKDAQSLQAALPLLQQVQAIEEKRQLLAEPDPLAPLIAQLTQILREELNWIAHQYNERHQEGMNRLSADSNWQQLTPEQRNQLLSAQKLTEAERPNVQVQDTQAILDTLAHNTLSALADRVAAMPSRFDAVAQEAAELCEPQTQFIRLPRRTLKTEAELEQWLEEVKQQLQNALTKGSITLQ